MSFPKGIIHPYNLKKGDPNPGGAISRDKVRAKNYELVKGIVTTYPGLKLKEVAHYAGLSINTVYVHMNSLREDSIAQLEHDLEAGEREHGTRLHISRMSKNRSDK